MAKYLSPKEVLQLKKDLGVQMWIYTLLSFLGGGLLVELVNQLH